VGLSILSRGTLEEKLKWTFSLYDINGDGAITPEEMTEMIAAIYDLMGKTTEPVDETVLKNKVDAIFRVPTHLQYLCRGEVSTIALIHNTFGKTISNLSVTTLMLMRSYCRFSGGPLFTQHIYNVRLVTDTTNFVVRQRPVRSFSGHLEVPLAPFLY